MIVVVALDLPTIEENENLVKILDGVNVSHKNNVALKVGLNTFIAGGPSFVKNLKTNYPQFSIVLDLKLHDIPNTMASAAQRITEMGVDYFTIHASSGLTAMTAVKRAITGPKYKNPPKIMAVTVLTSMGDAECRDIYKRKTSSQVNVLFHEALDAGVDGVVCSPLELQKLNKWAAETAAIYGRPIHSYLTMVPGVELTPRNDDQRRKGGLKEVFEGMASHIVVGRPIYQSSNPVEQLDKLLDKLSKLKNLRLELDRVFSWGEISK